MRPSVSPRPELAVAQPSPTAGLYEAVVRTLRARHYAPRTERAYVHWIGRYIQFHGGAHPSGMRESEVNAFVSDLAVRENVAASTQNQALAAVLFLYEQVLDEPLDRIEGVVRARRDKRLPTVLTRQEVRAVIRQMDGVPRVVALLLYGSGLRLLEALTLRVKDLDLGRGEIRLRDTKGNADRVTMLPQAMIEPVRHQLRATRSLHRRISMPASAAS